MISESVPRPEILLRDLHDLNSMQPTGLRNRVILNQPHGVKILAPELTWGVQLTFIRGEILR